MYERLRAHKWTQTASCDHVWRIRGRNKRIISSEACWSLRCPLLEI